jgi:predicted nuclease of predicted toxin-antitoxin system
VRFLADMGISGRTVTWLRQLGHDAVHLRDLGWQRATDAEAMARAAHEGRIILTMDLDFGYLLSVSQQRTPSVILFRLSDERSSMVNARLSEVLDRCTEALEMGAIISVSDSAIRVRQLPL